MYDFLFLTVSEAFIKANCSWAGIRRTIEKQRASRRAGLGNQDCINANGSGCTAGFLPGEGILTNGFRGGGGNWENFGCFSSCAASARSYGKWVHLGRGALLAAASGLPKPADA